MVRLRGGHQTGTKNQTKGLKPENRQPKPVVAPASPEAANNLKRIKVPAGLQLDLWAAEPMLANPVAFCIDERGRIFVSETYRYRTSALDIRQLHVPARGRSGGAHG